MECTCNYSPSPSVVVNDIVPPLPKCSWLHNTPNKIKTHLKSMFQRKLINNGKGWCFWAFDSTNTCENENQKFEHLNFYWLFLRNNVSLLGLFTLKLIKPTTHKIDIYQISTTAIMSQWEMENDTKCFSPFLWFILRQHSYLSVIKLFAFFCHLLQKFLSMEIYNSLCIMFFN